MSTDQATNWPATRIGTDAAPGVVVHHPELTSVIAAEQNSTKPLPAPPLHPGAALLRASSPMLARAHHVLTTPKRARRFSPAERLMNDYSDYQDSVSARAQRRAGRRIVMIKAAEGIGKGGAIMYRSRVQAAHAEGLRVIHYHYLHWDVLGHSQARFLLDTIAGLFKPGDRLCADIEAPLPGNEQGSLGASVHTSAGWAAELHRHGHTGLVGYASRGWPQLRALTQSGWFSGWLIAEYGTLRRPTPIDYAAVGRHAVIFGRQFTDGTAGPGPHTGPGISGPCDCSWLTTAGCEFIIQ